MDLITITALSINIFTLIVLYGTLREIKNQRIGAYLPELLIKEKIITFNSEYSEDGFKILNFPNMDLPDKLSTDPEYVEMVSGYPILETKSKQFSFEIFNIGLGTAKNIKVEFTYDYVELAKLIHKLDMDNKVNINISEGKIQLEIVGYLDVYLPMESISDYVYIKNNEEAIFYIPYTFVDLYCLYWTLQVRAHNFSADSSFDECPSSLPRINIKINYVDIYNRNLTKSYVINYRSCSYYHDVKGIFQTSFKFVPEEETS